MPQSQHIAELLPVAGTGRCRFRATSGTTLKVLNVLDLVVFLTVDDSIAAAGGPHVASTGCKDPYEPVRRDEEYHARSALVDEGDLQQTRVD
ncbi:hypothetical protein PC128_g21782 [Phytophthora cactorum]|nr:hypothetical protein PC128_g21782 [Phytophthora cactorum]